MAKIIYTHTDEAPLLATYSFLPIIAGVRRQGRRRRRDPRHLAGGPDPRAVRGRAPTTRSPSSATLAKTPEANIIKLPNVSASIPQLKAAIKELQEQGYDLPDYPENAADRRGEGRPREVRQGQGLRGQPGAARGQLRPARAAVGQELREDAPAPHGRVVRRLEDQRRDDGQGRLPLQRAVGRHRRRRHADASSTSAADGTVTVLKDGDQGARRRGRRRHLHERRRAAPLPHRADRPGQGRRRAVLGAPQGHDDEGLRPDHLRPRRAGVLPDAVRAVRRRSSAAAGISPNDGLGALLTAVGSAARGRRDQGRGPAGPRRRPATWRWSTPTRASPTCTSPPTSSSTPRCRR